MSQMTSNIWQRDRLASFKDWAFGDNAICSRFKLAEAGFFMNCTQGVDEKNVATCFVCYKSLYWEEQDDPWLEHISHAPNCQFVKLNKKEMDQTIGEFIDMMKHSGVNYKKIFMQEIAQKIEKQIDNYKRSRKG